MAGAVAHTLASADQETSADSFVDRQIRGPFSKWVHRHTFRRLDDNTTEVLDQVEADISEKWLQRLLGLGMWINMPVLFAYRGWKTRRILEQNG